MAIGAATSAGSALATASTAGPPPADQVAAEVTKSPRQAAAELQRLHDQLKSSFDARDLAGVVQSTGSVHSALGAIKLRGVQWGLHGQTVQNLDQAKKFNTELAAQLGAPVGSGSGSEVPIPPLPPVPPVPPPLDKVSDLVQGLLVSLQGIVQDLLPIAEPPSVEVPAIPVPVPVP